MVDSVGRFLKVFFRNLKRNRASSLINVAGLSLSLMSFVVIYLYVVDELTFDSLHPDAENVYRISHSYERTVDGVRDTDARAGGMWVLTLKERMPEVEAYTRFSRFGFPGSVAYDERAMLFEEKQFFWADPNYTEVFSLPMIVGDPARALSDPRNVIVNETTAAKYFGDSDPVGKELIYRWGGNEINLVVAGVMKNYPSNAHFHPDFIASNVALDVIWKRNGTDRVNHWQDTFTYSYFRLKDGTDPSKALAELDNIFKEKIDGKKFTALQPVITKLTDIHFTHDLLISLEEPGDKVYPFISASIGILILMMAAINYMNLATARSARRSKEVGLIKTLGGRRASVVSQFMGESVMTIFISFVLSIGLTILMLPFFNEVTGKNFTIGSLFATDVLLILVVMILLLAFVSGSYPAFYLSSFKPAEILRGTASKTTGSETFRKVLVVFQFVIATLLIVSAIIINSQISFIRSGNLAKGGKTLTVRLPSFVDKDKVVFRELVKANSNVEVVSLSSHLPRLESFSFITLPFIIPSIDGNERMMDKIKMDDGFADMFDLDFVAGRNFSPEIPGDTNNMILNEAAVKSLGLSPSEVVGREIMLNVERFPYKGIVIGVTKDFAYRSVRGPVLPAVMESHYLGAETLNANLRSGHTQETIEDIERSWKKVYPNAPFQYWFMDQEFDRVYKQELQMGKLSDYFTALSIVIACLGLFGLASFTVEQRTKEIGIRKVLGANTGQILLMLTNRFVILVLISFVIAVPLAFYAMTSWLENFAYKVPLDWSAFAGAGLLILVLTYITVGVESIRAARVNPSTSIRRE